MSGNRYERDTYGVCAEVAAKVFQTLQVIDHPIIREVMNEVIVGDAADHARDTEGLLPKVVVKMPLFQVGSGSMEEQLG